MSLRSGQPKSLSEEPSPPAPLPLEKNQQARGARNFQTPAKASPWFYRLQPPEETLLIGLALVIGGLSALGAIAFHELIGLTAEVFFGRGKEILEPLGAWTVILLPAAGGLIVGLISAIFLPRRHGGGHGVAGIMESVALYGGRLDSRSALVRVIGAAITLGSGGSAGPEDPSVQIGANLAATIGQQLRLSDTRMTTLVAAGAAAGIASAFNAPIAGVFFALEIILGELSGAALGIVVLAAVASSAVTQALVGPQPAFIVSAYTYQSLWELPFYAVLGALAAIVSIFYIQSLYRIADLFQGLHWPIPFKAALGGLMVGLVGLFFPQIFSIGYPAITTLLSGTNLALGLLLTLVLLKPVVTSITLGSGGSGGLFAPSLFMGAMLGGLVGEIAHGLFPGITSPPAVYAMVGMAAVLAGAVRAPITAILLLFEMTRDYRIILPLMAGAIVASFLAERWHQDSVYTLGLRRRGVNLQRGRDIDVMQGVLVSEVMTTEVDTVPGDLPLVELERKFIASYHHGFPVLTGDQLLGMATLADLNEAKSQPGWEQQTAGDIATRDLLVAYPDESVWAALRRLSTRDVGRLPVVDRRNPQRLLGVIRRNDILRAYRRAIVRRVDAQERAEHLRLRNLTGHDFVQIQVEPSSAADGKSVRELRLPHECLLTSIRHDHEVRLPHGEDTLRAGDVVMALVEPGAAQEFRSIFQRGII